MSQTKINAAALKAKTKPRTVVGPFQGRIKPPADRPGLYLRESAKTGQMCWAYWNGTTWGLYSDSKKGAMARRHKASKKTLPWFAFHKRTTTARPR